MKIKAREGVITIEYRDKSRTFHTRNTFLNVLWCVVVFAVNYLERV